MPQRNYKLREISRRDALLVLATVSVAPILGRIAQASDKANPEPANEVSNSLPNIEKMIADAERRGGGTVKLPAGRYLLDPGNRTTALTLPANVRLEGAGRDQTTLLMAAGARGHVINAPYGWTQIADLTIDANAANRKGERGHALRVEGEQIVVERVRLTNSPSYGLGIGQRRFARNVTISNVEIIGAGADGIDVKNRLARTEEITLQDITVKGFGLPDPALATTAIGSEQDRMRGKAAVDLRGKCTVRGIRIVGLQRGRSGLRFRFGEASTPNGPGAHGSKASGIVIEGNGEGIAIAVNARDVELTDLSVSNVAIMLRLAEDRTVVDRADFRAASHAAVFAAKTHISSPKTLIIRAAKFFSPRRFIMRDLDQAVFDSCVFSDCQNPLSERLLRDPHVKLVGCRFDSSCG